jgi:hypothetical protein
MESLQDLKPDPADTTAQTLAIMSQTLVSIANGQPVDASSISASAEASAFLPSRSAVLVNTLWFLSLSLSVFVSLVAILAKDWFYRFMLGRYGDTYAQAKQRQDRWDGILKWKLKTLLRYLPVALHLALCEFSLQSRRPGYYDSDDIE